jgi:NAD(P)-dependent dehydrogenase (short-subunit alcohol dehydrogenase family)
MKTYLIAGGNSGIGLEVVKILEQEHRIIVISRTDKNSDRLNHVQFYQANILSDSLPEITDPIDGLVYCPGSINLKPFKNLTEEDFMRDFSLNVMGAVKIIQKYYNNLKITGNASIVLFSTVAVQTGMPFHASVSAAKGAIEGLTRSLAAEFTPLIRVNCLAPSIIDTPLAEKLLNTETKVKAAVERHPLKRIGNVKEVAQLVAFLLSDASSFMTAQIIKIDGGLSSIKAL